MSEPCGECGSDVIETVESVPYECGLDGVMLDGITVRRCPNCGEHEVDIPNTLDLHRTLAVALASKRAKLAPKEVRFLRKCLGLSSTDFARKIGVDKATVSRWERVDEPTPMGGQVERLLRVLVLSEKPVDSYPLEEIASGEPAPLLMRLANERSGWRPEAP